LQFNLKKGQGTGAKTQRVGIFQNV